MTISSSIHRHAPNLDPNQLDVVGHLEGPLQVLSGPGAGKTRVLIWRLVNLLLQGVCGPDEVALLAFGHLAAAEMRRRVEAAAHLVGYRGDVGKVRISTIHSLAHRILRERHRRVGRRSDYDLLSRERQGKFMAERYNDIFGSLERDFVIFGWNNPRQIITRAARCFDLITEEDISPLRLVDSGNAFHQLIGRACIAYEDALLEHNLADFSHLLLWANTALEDDRIAKRHGADLRHLMVDEYQDVSQLMERISLRLARFHGNPAVVGDADQSIYRFRGAGPEALLGFGDRFKDCRLIRLNTNYRSDPHIVRACNILIAPNHEDGYEHTMVAHASDDHTNYPAVVTVLGRDVEEETEQLLDLVKFLCANRVVSDHSDIAFLVHSVKERVIRPYAEAFESAGIHVHRGGGNDDDDAFGARPGGRRRHPRFPRGRLPILTMHAAKGLQWPVVIVSTAEPMWNDDNLDEDLRRRYGGGRYHEPANRIQDHDRRRQYYVACTRAQNLLVLTGNVEQSRAPAFDAIWHELPPWPSVDRGALARRKFTVDDSRNVESSSRIVTIDRLEHVLWLPEG